MTKVKEHAVVPHNDVTDGPAMPVRESPIGRMHPQFVEELFTFVERESGDVPFVRRPRWSASSPVVGTTRIMG
jgi:hypothetical protein